MNTVNSFLTKTLTAQKLYKYLQILVFPAEDAFCKSVSELAVYSNLICAMMCDRILQQIQPELLKDRPQQAPRCPLLLAKLVEPERQNAAAFTAGSFHGLSAYLNLVWTFALKPVEFKASRLGHMCVYCDYN